MNRPLEQTEPIRITATPSEQYSQSQSHILDHLEPGAKYEAVVRSKNRFGWGKFSNVFEFETSTEGKSYSYLEWMGFERN